MSLKNKIKNGVLRFHAKLFFFFLSKSFASENIFEIKALNG